MGKIKEFIQNHLVDIVISASVIVFVFGIWLLYTANRTVNEYSDVHDTVQSVESDNQQARQQINSASKQIEHAQNKLNDSIKRTGEITNRVNNAQKRTDGNSKIIRECEDIVSAGRRDVEEARGIFESVDKANKVNGAQADDNP